MTIKPLDQLNQILANKPSPARPAAAEAPDFAGFLAERPAAAPAQAAAGSSASALLEKEALSGLIRTGMESAGLQAKRQLEQTLDQMDRYAEALGDEAKSLKEIAPLADDLGQAADRLSRISRNLGESDPLKGLSNEAAVLATVEAMKFRRGDYV